MHLNHILSEGKAAVYSVILGRFEVEVKVLLIDKEETAKPGKFMGLGSFGVVYADNSAKS